MSIRPELTGSDIRALLVELGTRLSAEGVRGDIRLVGGAAVIFSGEQRRVTADIDASYAPKEVVERIAGEMAARHDLPANWLNDRAKAFIPSGAQWVQVSVEDLDVFRASDETLLAMKLAAERDKDAADIGFLASKLALTSPEQIVDLAFQMYGDDSMALGASRENYLIVAEDGLNNARHGGRPTSEPDAVRTWVETHQRNGRPVAGHWRNRR